MASSFRTLSIDVEQWRRAAREVPTPPRRAFAMGVLVGALACAGLAVLTLPRSGSGPPGDSHGTKFVGPLGMAQAKAAPARGATAPRQAPRQRSITSARAAAEVEERGGPSTGIGKLFGDALAQVVRSGDALTAKNGVVVITGASSGLGLSAMKTLCGQGYFVVAAVRDPDKMAAAAATNGIPEKSYAAIPLQLASLQSVRDFVGKLRLLLAGRPLNHLICNAAIYNPTDPQPVFTEDGYEMALQVNHLGHFLLVQLLLPDLRRARDARCIIVGSVTGNSNTVAGGVVRPRADLGKLEGLREGGTEVAMPASPSERYDGAKAYKDAKALNMITAIEMHRRFHEETGVAFSSLYPGCICDTDLFREKRAWFRTLWPQLMKAIGAYVTEEDAGARLAQTITDPRCAKSGVYWGWGGKAQNIGNGLAGGGGEFGKRMIESDFSDMLLDEATGAMAFRYSMEAVKEYLPAGARPRAPAREAVAAR